MGVSAQIDGVAQWFQGLSSSHRREALQALVPLFEPPEWHFVADVVAPIGHSKCVSNCHDAVGALPDELALAILRFLDPFELGGAMRVCRRWHDLAGRPDLWQALASTPHSTLPIACDSWRALVGERQRLRRNWSRGRFSLRTFMGHTQSVCCVHLNADKIASGSNDGTVKVWSTKTNATWSVLTLHGHMAPVRCLEMREQTLVSGSNDRTIRVWTVASGPGWVRGSCRLTIAGHTDTVRCLQYSPDLAVIVSGSYDASLRVWEAGSGACRRVLWGHDGAVLSVQFDAVRIVSGGMDMAIRVWNFQSGACLATLTGHRGGVTCLHYTVATGRIFSGSLDGDLRFWDVDSGECVDTLDWICREGHTGVIRSLQADQWHVVSASDDKSLKIWDAQTGRRLATLRCHASGVTCVSFNDRQLVSGSFDETLKLLDFSTVK